MPRQSTSSLPSIRQSTDSALRKVKYAGRSVATVLGERVWPNARELSNPRIDKGAVEEALKECLSLLGAPQRPLRWFPDAETARPALRPYEFCKAYWPLRHAVPALDEAWRAMMPAPVDSPRVPHPRRTASDDTPREALPASIGELIQRLEGNGSSSKSLYSALRTWAAEPEHAKEYLPCVCQPGRVRIANAAGDDVLFDRGNLVETHQGRHLEPGSSRRHYRHGIGIVTRDRGNIGDHHVCPPVFIGGNDQRWPALGGGQVGEGEIG